MQDIELKIQRDCEASLQSLSQQLLRIYVKPDQVQPRIKPVAENRLPARDTARPG